MTGVIVHMDSKAFSVKPLVKEQDEDTKFYQKPLFKIGVGLGVITILVIIVVAVVSALSPINPHRLNLKQVSTTVSNSQCPTKLASPDRSSRQ